MPWEDIDQIAYRGETEFDRAYKGGILMWNPLYLSTTDGYFVATSDGEYITLTQ